MPSYSRLRLWWIRQEAALARESFAGQHCNATAYPCPVCGKVPPPTVPVCLGPHPGLTAPKLRELGVLE